MFSVSGITLLIMLWWSSIALAYDDHCHLQYPVVLSYHWGIAKICQNCDTYFNQDSSTDYVKVDTDNDHKPDTWVTKPEVMAMGLPPKQYNSYDITYVNGKPVYRLARAHMKQYYRYFSSDIVNILKGQGKGQCGNQVFLADKPPYASLATRAQSLRNTVIEALTKTGKAKVNIIGMSQGVQDARYMMEKLSYNGHLMKYYVASLSSIVGEDQGAGAGQIVLKLSYVLTRWICGSWGNYLCNAVYQGNKSDVKNALWKDRANKYVLIENATDECPGTYHTGNPNCTYNLLERDRYRAWLNSITSLSIYYMTGKNYVGGYDFHGNLHRDWLELIAYLGLDHETFQKIIKPNGVDNEMNNGVLYYSYSACIQNWDKNKLGWDVTYAAMSDDVCFR